MVPKLYIMHTWLLFLFLYNFASIYISMSLCLTYVVLFQLMLYICKLSNYCNGHLDMLMGSDLPQLLSTENTSIGLDFT